jgi:hypothetical protein
MGQNVSKMGLNLDSIFRPLNLLKIIKFILFNPKSLAHCDMLQMFSSVGISDEEMPFMEPLLMFEVGATEAGHRLDGHARSHTKFVDFGINSN